MNLRLGKWQVPRQNRVSRDKLYTVYGGAGTYSCGGLWNDGGTLFSKAQPGGSYWGQAGERQTVSYF